jgi:DNA-binding NarL/FixJ family response regulator
MGDPLSASTRPSRESKMPRAESSRASPKRRQVKARVALAIEDRWRRQGIEALLGEEGFAVGVRNVDLVLADAPRPWRDIREALLRLSTRLPGAGILVFIPELRFEYAEPCFRFGAMGVLHFNSDPGLILRAIEAVRQGGVWAPRNLMVNAVRGLSNPSLRLARGEFIFTRAERRILRALRDELTNKEIASLLRVSEATLKFHISRLLQKTHTASRHQLRRLVSSSTLPL